ncbi:hypothetical protein CPB83DRAFT_811862 [Crepidotus variabilis]|uniref:Septation protein imp2 n=1 Tax=Crepidotus variabilis TaxID=179855 RepID=A0A9P6EIU8_9AGAR|nr:hypothetical protein CPB83DRAFT_811862 [Crepidotus variabilis]
MAARPPQPTSVTSLARFAVTRQADLDPFNGSTSRDYCNSFWGLGDAGPNLMFARMRGASKTTDELKNYWNERCLIEEEYAAKLSKLAKVPVGGDEIGELRNSLDTLRIETEKQAQNHFDLASQVRSELEDGTAKFHQRQINHRRQVQAPLERKFKEKQVQESYVKKSKEKYESDCLRIRSYTQQTSYMTGSDLQKVQQKLARTKQTMQGNEKDYARFTKELQELLSNWEREWKDFCDSCQDLEEERLDFMKDVLWSYANAISTICVADDQSCERIRTALDQLEPEKDVENFVNEYGTGNTLSEPADFLPSSGSNEPDLPGSPIVRLVQYSRISKRPPQQGFSNDIQIAPEHVDPLNDSASHAASAHVNGDNRSQRSNETSMYTSRTQTSPPQTSPPSHPPPPVPEPTHVPPPTSVTPQLSNSSSGHQQQSSGAASSSSSSRAGPSKIQRFSQPLPITPQGGESSRAPAVPPPPLPNPQQHNKILFYVKALYDYQATIPEEFDFQSGDIIAVTATPDDGWWSGELLDEARREVGRNVFPSNFVCLF